MIRRTVAILLVASLATAGCISHVRVGVIPNVEQLEGQLHLGQSTQNDVRQVLGEPFGRGRANLPIDPAGRPGPMWIYYYEDTDLDRRVTWGLMLFVYFDGDRYVGYMWFSSLPK